MYYNSINSFNLFLLKKYILFILYLRHKKPMNLLASHCKVVHEDIDASI